MKPQYESNEAVTVGCEKSVDTELIYSRVTEIQPSGREID